MITKLLVTFITLSFLILGCEKKEQPAKEPLQEQKVEKELKKENKIILTSTDNTDYEITADYRGLKFKGSEDRVVLLDFFATWCPPCRAEMPHLVHLQNKYADKIQIFSILMEENKQNSELKGFIDEYKLNFPILNSKENFFLSQALGGIKSLPTLVIYDKSGEYFTHFLGAAPEEMLEAAIVKALAK